MTKTKATLLLALMIAGMFAAASLAAVTAADSSPQYRDVPDQWGEYIDLLGNVTYWVDPTGQSYEGKDYYTSLSNPALQTGTIDFALEIGAHQVLYYLMPDGSVPHSIEDLYAGAIAHVLYDDRKVPEQGNSIGLLAANYTGGESNNLTVDTLDEGSTSDQFALYDLVDNTTSGIVSTRLVGGATSSAYSRYERHLLNFGASDLMYDTVDKGAVTQTYGTENITRTTYVWLARYIEDAVSSIEPYTANINASTENINSEAVTMYVNSDAVQSMQDSVDEVLADAGVTSYSFSSMGRDLLRKVTPKSGTFSFSKGMSVSSLAKRTYAAAKKGYDNLAGNSLLKSYVKATLAPVTIPLALGNKWSSKASQVTNHFFSNAAKKLRGGPFGFLSGPIKMLSSAVSFVLKYWWLWLSLIVVAFVMFATPVGPFLMSNAIGKIIK